MIFRISSFIEIAVFYNERDLKITGCMYASCTFYNDSKTYIQLKSDQTERLLNKPYVNEVHLTGQNLN